MSTSMQPNPDPLTHYQREKIEQVARAMAKAMTTPRLRLVRAKIADLLDTNLPLPIEEMYRIRGCVVHAELSDRESPTPTVTSKLGRWFADINARDASGEKALIQDRMLP